MKFKEWLLAEALEYQPENWKQFIAKTNKKLIIIGQELSFEKMKSFLEHLKSLKNHDDYVFNNITINLHYAAVNLVSHYTRIIQEESDFNSPVEEIDYMMSKNCYYDYNRVFQRLKRITTKSGAKEAYLESLNEHEQSFENGFCGTDEETIAIVKDFINKIKRIIDLADYRTKVITNFENKYEFRCKIIRSSQGRMSDQFKTRDTFPAHEDFEIMYHATSNVEAILKEGFKTQRQLRKEGKGAGLGGGDPDVISFTANPKIASAIAKGLKTVTQIVKGNITFDEIFSRYKKTGILNDDDTKYMYDNERGVNDTFYLYRLALSRMDDKGLIYNPVFGFAVLESFKDIDTNKIGVIQAKIDMSKVKEYLPAEEEYRVLPEGISEIKIIT
jgi:hypothetical protein